MPRFYFNIRDGDEFVEDSQGTDLPELQAARAKALESARLTLRKKVLAGEVIDGKRFEITNGEGDILTIMPFKQALRLS